MYLIDHVSSRCRNRACSEIDAGEILSRSGRCPILGHRAYYKSFSTLSGFLFAVIRSSTERPLQAPLTMFFVNSGEITIAIERRLKTVFLMHQARNKRTFKRLIAGVTSGAQDFKNVEQFGHRHLNRADSESHPAKETKSIHSSVIDQACQTLISIWRQVEREQLWL